MDLNSKLIDQVVGNVMRELASRGTGEALAPVSASGPVVIESRVITESVLSTAGVIGGAIIVSSTAVFTPSGRDYLRRHGITVSDGGGGATGADRSRTPGRLLLAIPAPAVSAGAVAAGWQVTDASGLSKLVELAAAAASSGQRSLTCCSQPSLTACLLNRDPARRAAVVTPTTCFTGLMSQMNPDILCLSPEGWSVNACMRLCRHLSIGEIGPPVGWPEVLQ